MGVERRFYVYILTNWMDDLLYVGVTNDIARRMDEHKNGMFAGHTKKYVIHKLVYVEVFDSIEAAIRREKQIKGMRRSRKQKLVSDFNPEWREIEVV